MAATFFPDLKGKSVFITGGASGIGAALTEGFLRQGANVAFLDLVDGTEFSAVMEANHGAAPLAMRGDVTDTAGLQAAMGQAAETNGPIEVLVNNAANDLRHSADEVTEPFWDEMLGVNLKSYFFACQQAARQMTQGGTIVNFSSISYIMGNSGMPLYTTANAGITGMTRSLAREFGPRGIRVNALAPGWVLTEKQMEKWATPADLAVHLERQCLKEHLTPEDIVDPTLFLASNASRMMTGQCMAVDGGVVVSG